MKHRFDLYSKTTQLIIDGSLFAASFSAAYLMRFEGFPPDWATTKQWLLWLPCLVAARLLVNRSQGVYRFIWRYISLHEAVAITRSLLLVTIGLLGLRLLYPRSYVFGPRLHIPLGIIALEYLISLIATLGIRALRRVVYERNAALLVKPLGGPRRVLLYGAGNAGILLVKNVRNRGDVSVVGFLDDDPRKLGTVLAGSTVLGKGECLDRIVRDQAVDQVVISIASPGKEFLSSVLTRCRGANVPVKIIPSLQDLFLRCTDISQFREVRIEDLLGRDGIDVTEHRPMIHETYRGKRILVTGAGGSIGSELVRQLLLFDPKSVAVLDKDENAVFELEQELVSRFSTSLVEPCVADIRDCARLSGVFEDLKPQIVFHAAAHKHVPMMEKNPCEAILNNVGGAHNVLEAATRCSAERFIYISSDKAVNPTNVMGATKRLGELMVKSYARDAGLTAACVRFGNVLGSRGSVIPVFQKQIAQGGPVTVTHPDIVRFFMTIPEAVRLVLCAGSLAEHGETFVLDMGAPRRVIDLAYEMIALAGFAPGKDIGVRITGLRPGEKLFEELVDSTETLCKTKVRKLMMITSQEDGRFAPEHVSELIRAARANDRLTIYRNLLNMGIGFRTGPPSRAVKVVQEAVEALGALTDGKPPSARKLSPDRTSGFLSPSKAAGEA
jgi:FlaA1/EpsC-like NDP-sugar epimerase